MSTCSLCKGRGHFIQQKNGISRTILCPSCRGKNKQKIAINYNKCMYCGGTGFIVGCCGDKTIECTMCQP